MMCTGANSNDGNLNNWKWQSCANHVSRSQLLQAMAPRQRHRARALIRIPCVSVTQRIRFALKVESLCGGCSWDRRGGGSEISSCQGCFARRIGLRVASMVWSWQMQPLQSSSMVVIAQRRCCEILWWRNHESQHLLALFSYVSSCFSSNSKSRLTRHLPVLLLSSSRNLLRLLFLRFSVFPSKICVLSMSYLQIPEADRRRHSEQYIQGTVESHITCTCTTFGNKNGNWSYLCHLTLFWQVLWINLILRPQKHNRYEPFGLRPCATSTNSTKFYSISQIIVSQQ